MVVGRTKKQAKNGAIGYKIITKALGLLKTLHYLCCVNHTLMNNTTVMNDLTESIEQLAQELPPITLKEMSAIRLMNRTDQKYLTNVNTLKQLLTMVRGSYYAQEIDGQRVSPYATTYLDDPQTHAMFRQHETGRKPRQKVRVRTYVNSDLTFLEIKKKDNHGTTRKTRIQVPSLDDVVRKGAGTDFLHEQTGLWLSQISPAVGNRFSRITLVNYDKTERLTIDFDIQFYNYHTEEHSEMENIVVIELKRDGRCHSPILPMLRQLRIKPAGFSKYCIGASVTDEGLHINRFKKRLIKIRKIQQAHAMS